MSILEAINKVLDMVRAAEEPADASDGIVNVASFLEREKFINLNTSCISQCKLILELLESQQTKAVKKHHIDKKNITLLMGGTTELPSPIANTPIFAPLASLAPLTPTVPPVSLAPTNPKNLSWSNVCSRPSIRPPRPVSQPTYVEVVEGISIPAIHVFAFEASMPPGVLHYIKDQDRFGIIIAGRLFEGNIGKIFNGSPPTKAKNCSHKICGGAASGCSYYHPGETRNYTPMSWVYAVGPDSYKYKICRKFGDRDNLVIDKKAITAEQKEIFFDQTMHDILCSIVLAV